MIYCLNSTSGTIELMDSLVWRLLKQTKLACHRHSVIFVWMVWPNSLSIPDILHIQLHHNSPHSHTFFPEHLQSEIQGAQLCNDKNDVQKNQVTGPWCRMPWRNLNSTHQRLQRNSLIVRGGNDQNGSSSGQTPHSNPFFDPSFLFHQRSFCRINQEFPRSLVIFLDDFWLGLWIFGVKLPKKNVTFFMTFFFFPSQALKQWINLVFCADLAVLWHSKK